MNRPDRFFFRIARPAARKQGARRFVVLRFHEELGKRRMCPVRAAIVQADLGIAGQFEGSCSPAMVDDSKRPHFCVELGATQTCQETSISSARQRELCPVSMKSRVRGYLPVGKVVACRWTIACFRPVSDVAKLAPAIACDILPPPSNVKVPPCPPTGTGSSDHDAVVTVGEQSDGVRRIHQVRSAIVSRRLGRAVAVN